MNWLKKLEWLVAAARINAEGHRKPVERTLIRKRVKTATLSTTTAEWREKGKQ